jgi:hypothetical protein
MEADVDQTLDEVITSGNVEELIKRMPFDITPSNALSLSVVTVQEIWTQELATSYFKSLALMEYINLRCPHVESSLYVRLMANMKMKVPPF